MTPEQLVQAKEAYHRLATGQAARAVLDGVSGDKIEYQGASLPALLAYIQATDPMFQVDVTTSRVTRPFRFVF